MFEIGNFKKFKFVVVGGALLLTVGCAQQTVKSDESVASASASASASRSGSMTKEGSMTEAERRLKRDAFKRSLQEFQKAPVYFDFDKSKVRPDMRPVLDRKAQFLHDFPSVRIQVEGHCDERGTAEYNIALGHRRAQQTKDYLVSLGVSASRIDTVSYGEERPADPRSQELAWAKNRRAMFNAIGGIPTGMN